MSRTVPRPHEISVIVQGPIAGKPDDPAKLRLTATVLASVRRHLPGAEIVLSTWEGADVSNLAFDTLVESTDPGGMRCDNWPNPRLHAPTPYNANRQIVSTREGARAASRPYAMKLRSDMMLTGAGFLDFFQRYPARNQSWRILRDRVVVPNWFSRNPHAPDGQCFHPSDWWQFGWREDIVTLWDSPLTDAEQPMWFASRPRPVEYGDSHLNYRYTVEQYTWLAFLRRFGTAPLEHRYDVRPDVVALSELTLVNNLVVADMRSLGLRFLKYHSSLTDWRTLYTHGEWQQLYKQYCDPSFEVPFDGTALRKAAYSAIVAPVHELLMSPRRIRGVGAVNRAWERAHPASFNAVKRGYARGWGMVGTLLRRRG